MDALNAEAEKLKLMSEQKNTSNTTHLETPRSRSDSGTSERTLLNMSDADETEKRRSGDLEKDVEGVEGVEGVVPTIVTKDHVTEDPLARVKLLCWMFVNTVATVMIVSPPLSFRKLKNSITRANSVPMLLNY